MASRKKWNVKPRTGTSLTVPAAALTSGALVTLGVTRNGAAAADTFPGKAQVHHAKLRYTGSTAGSSGSSGTPGTKFINLDFHGAADTAHIKESDRIPYLEFSPDIDDRSIWTVTVPADYQTGTDMFVEVYWSPTDSTVGSTRWSLEYKSIAPGGILSGPAATSTLTQPASGTAFLLQTTGTSLTIPAASISANAMLSLAVSRLGTNAADTYAGKARVHVVRVRYTGLTFS